METRRFRYELLGVLAFAVTVGGCIHTPSGASQQSTAPVTLRGATWQPYEHVDLFLRDRRGKPPDSPPPPDETWLTEVSTASSPSPNGLYDWSVTIPPSLLPPSAWIPQNSDGRAEGGLAHSVGRLEIVARPRAPDGRNLGVVSCVLTGRTPAIDCAEGDSFLVYDNDGVGVEGPPPAAADFHLNGPPIALTGQAQGVLLEVGTYQMPGLGPLSSSVNAVVCRPAEIPPSGLRTVILNHGNISLGPDALNACVKWARAGWLAALSAYRFQPIVAPGYPSGVGQQGSVGVHELCLGEVTDVLRWLDIVRARSDTDDAQILMWGHSHGACITLRSLEQGAKVKAAVAVAAPTDFFTWNPELNAWVLGGTSGDLPEAYQARSAVRMAVDLQRRNDVRLLLIAVQGDTIVPPSQSCLLANAIGAENHLMLANGEYSPSTVPPGVVDGCGSLTLSGAPVNWNTRAVFLLYSNRSSTDGHFLFGDATPPPPGQAWDLPREKGIRDFLQTSFP